MAVDQKTADALVARIEKWQDEGKELRRAVRQLARGRALDFPLPADDERPYAANGRPDVDEMSRLVALYLVEHKLLPVQEAQTLSAAEPPLLDLDTIVQQVYARLRNEFAASSTPNSAPIDLGQIEERVFTRLKEEVLSSSELKRAIRQAVSELDIQQLIDQVWDEFSADTMHEFLAELLKERVAKEVDLKELVRLLVEKIVEDESLDFDTINSDLAQELSDRMEVTFALRK